MPRSNRLRPAPRVGNAPAVFFVDADGCVDGVPYVLPHEPGERAFGLCEGYYHTANGEPEGPFGSHTSATRDAEGW